jgi:hypothetical protein
LTLFWGTFAVIFSFQVERIAPTVLEAINKIGSMVNGPLLALLHPRPGPIDAERFRSWPGA